MCSHWYTKRDSCQRRGSLAVEVKLATYLTQRYFLPAVFLLYWALFLREISDWWKVRCRRHPGSTGYFLLFFNLAMDADIAPVFLGYVVRVTFFFGIVTLLSEAVCLLARSVPRKRASEPPRLMFLRWKSVRRGVMIDSSSPLPVSYW